MTTIDADYMTEPPLNRATFAACLPGTQGDIRIGPDETRIILAIPASDKAEALKLTTMSGKLLRVSVEVDER